jgi:hypothetical protein
VDIRAAAEAPAGLALGSEVQVPFTERAVLAALLLQGRGYTRIYVAHD